MIKMFASDLDGTLLNALHEADGTIRRAIRELTEAGLHVFPRLDDRRCRSASMALRAWRLTPAAPMDPSCATAMARCSRLGPSIRRSLRNCSSVPGHLL